MEDFTLTATRKQGHKLMSPYRVVLESAKKKKKKV